jgi:uncharacterized protein
MEFMRKLHQLGYQKRFQMLAMSLFGTINLAIVNPALAQERLLRTLVVIGRGSEEVVMTKAQIQLGVEVQGKVAQEVQQEVIRRSNAVVELLRSRSVERLVTTEVRLSPNYRNDKGTQILTGYTGSVEVNFRVAIPQAGSIFDEAVKAGVNRIRGVSFLAEDAAIATARKAALREAAEDAQSQAKTVLEALGITQHEAITVQIDGAYAPAPRFVGADRLESRLSSLDAQQFSTTTRLSGEAIFPLAGGEQTVNASVTLQVRY